MLPRRSVSLCSWHKIQLRFGFPLFAVRNVLARGDARFVVKLEGDAGHRRKSEVRVVCGRAS